MKFLLLWLLVAVTAALTASMVSADTTTFTLDYDECKEVDNENNTIRICAPSDNSTDCNETITGDLLIDPGEIKTFEEGGCKVTCEARSGTSSDECGKCTKKRSLEAGDTYEVIDGACDLDIECEFPDVETFCGNQEDSYEYNAQIELVKSGDSVEIRVDNETVGWSLYDQDMNIDYNLPISCPTEINDTTLDDFSDESITRMAVLLDFMPSILEKNLELNDVWSARVEVKDEIIQKKDHDIQNLLDEQGRFKEAIALKDQEINNTKTLQLLASEEADKYQSKYEASIYGIIGIGMACGFLLLVCLGLIFAYVRKGRGDA